MKHTAPLSLHPPIPQRPGREILAANPDTGGSLGCAISEALEVAIKTENCRYVLGSVLDHVLLHQSIIGQEVKTACEKYDIQPDMIIGCVGSGSNFGGLIAPFMGEKLTAKATLSSSLWSPLPVRPDQGQVRLILAIQVK